MCEGRDSSMNVEEVSSVAMDTAFHLHRDLGPGLHQTGSEQTSGLRVFASSREAECRGHAKEGAKHILTPYFNR